MKHFKSVIALILLSTILCAAPVPKDAGTGNSKAVVSTLAEIGFGDTFGKLSEVPSTHAHDKVSLEEIRNNPSQSPFRAAILQSAPTIIEHRKFQFPTTLPAVDGGLDKAMLKRLQEKLAVRMIELEEAFELLELAEPLLERETNPRWKAHYELLHGWYLMEIARCHEFNLALGKMRIETTDLVLAEGHNAWKFEPRLKMMSGRKHKKMAEEGMERLEIVAKTHQESPWGEIAAILIAKPCGINIESTKIELKK